jgi:hypothetical protein
MKFDIVSALKLMKRADKNLRKAVEQEMHAARVFAAVIEKFGESSIREDIGATKFDEMMALHLRVKELGEEQFSRVRFDECKAELGVAPNQN